MKTKKFATIFAVTAALALCVAAMAGCSSNSSSSSSSSSSDSYTLVSDGTLTVASSLDFPPFESLDGDTPVGYDIAVIQEIASRLGLECDIQNTKFDTILRR